MSDRQAMATPRLRALADDLDHLDLSLSTRGETARAESIRLIRDVVLPRISDDTAPLVVAVLGPTGSGKSTLVNAMAGARLSETGALRPTTRSPVLWASHAPPPALDAVRRRHGLVEAPAEGRPPPDGLVVVDAPPTGPATDAVLDAADVCVIVASDRRYADAAMWDMVDRGARRGAGFVFVLDRIPVAPQDQQPLLSDFAARLADRGLVTRPEPDAVIGIPEAPPGDPVPVEWVAGVRKELEVLAEPMARRAIFGRVLTGALTSLRHSLGVVRAAAVDVEVIRGRLIDARDLSYGRQVARLVDEIGAGSLAGAAEFMDTMSADLAALVVRRAGHAARDTAIGWEEDSVGSGLLAGEPGLWTHAPGGLERSRKAFDEWRAETRSGIDDSSPRWSLRRTRRAMEVEASKRALGAEVAPSTRRGRTAHRRLDALPAVIDSARSRLAVLIGRVFADDAERFSAVIGSGMDGGMLARLIVPDADGGEAA